jgi:DnaJ-class molecular chaperone
MLIHEWRMRSSMSPDEPDGFSRGKMKQTKPGRIENKCAACRGTGFAVVKQPAQPGRRIYPPRCAKCHGSGRIRKIAG